jgi:hypothetical protein
MDNYNPQNETIQEILQKLEELLAICQNNISQLENPEVDEPVFQMMGCELANPATFEINEWDYGNRSIYAMKSGYSGAKLKAKNLRVNGTIAEKSFIYLKEDLFCGNCFGYVEAKNMVAESVGTFSNKKYFKDRNNFRIANTLIIKGQSLFAHVDTWNGEFRGLVRNSMINLGRTGIFHELGSGAHINIDPANSYFFVFMSEETEYLKEKIKALRKEKDKLEAELNAKKYEYEKMSRVELDKLPNLTRESIKENRLMYEDLIQRYDEVDVFFIKNIYDNKIKELNNLLSEVRKNALMNARIIIKTMKPQVTITVVGKSIFLGEEMENIVIKWNGSEIVVENME